MPPTRVLISGAGIAGPTLAWFLSKSGSHITIVEKAPSLLPYGQNIDISGSGISVIKKMGLMAKIRENNTTEKGTQFVTSQGKYFAKFPVKEGSSASPTSEFEILRGDLSKVLYEATKDKPNVEYKFGTTVEAVISNGEDAESIKVKLSNGEEAEFTYLIAADGQWSRLRKTCFPPESLSVKDTNMYAAYCTIPRESTDNEWWNVFVALKSRVITLRPDPHGTTRAMLTLMPRNSTQKQAWQEASRSSTTVQQDLLRKEFADAGWQARRILENMDKSPDFYFQALQQIRLSSWSTSRVVCVGDAAYAPTPLTGAGADLAILGAYVLAGELCQLGEGENPSKAFKAYEAAFRPWVEQTQNIPFFVPGIAHPTTALGKWLLETFMSTVSWIAATPWLLKWIDRDDSEEDFPLPKYAIFEGKNEGDEATTLNS